MNFFSKVSLKYNLLCKRLEEKKIANLRKKNCKLKKKKLQT